MSTVAERGFAGQPTWDPARFPPATPGGRAVVFARASRDPIGYLTQARRDLGPVFTLRLFPYVGIVCAADAASNQEVLTDQARFAGGEAAALIEPWVGSGSVLLTEGDQHLRNRRLLLPPFHGAQVARWSGRVTEVVRAELDDLPRGEAVSIRPMAQRLALDVILRMVFGLEDPARVREFRAALRAFLTPAMAALLFLRPLQRDLGPWSPGAVLAKRRALVDALIADELDRRRQLPGGDDILSVLLTATGEDGAPAYTDRQITDELRGLVVAGHETTATALAWVVHLLAHHPAEQAELIRSLDAGETAYLGAVIKEAMRFRPPVFDAVRTATDDTTLGGQPVPRGAIVSALFTVTHHDPALWGDPGVFRPERHLDGRPVPYALTPFGGGVRRCLGAALAQLELEVVLKELLSRFRLEPAGGRLEAARLQGVTIVPARGGRVVLRPR